MQIKDRIALVSGGAHRVGKSIALALAAQGAHTVITYLRSTVKAEETARELEAFGVQAMAIKCDQRDNSQIATLFARVKDRFGRLDILVNNAAIMERTPIFDITPDEWDRTLNTNLRGPFFMAQAAAKLMLTTHPAKRAPAAPRRTGRERSGAQSKDALSSGCIINIADQAALRPWPSYIAHTVSKAGLVTLTKALALALAPSIRVNAIAPGLILKPARWSDERWQRLTRAVPLGRSGTLQDLTDAVLFLIRSEFITGDLLVLDGGRELR